MGRAKRKEAGDEPPAAAAEAQANPPAPRKRKAAAAKPAAAAAVAGAPASGGPRKARAASKLKAAAQPSTAAEGEEPAEQGPTEPRKSTGYWLLKEEPDAFSMEGLQALGSAGKTWTGIRGNEAKNNLKLMRVGDRCMFYYSSCKVPGVAGEMLVTRAAYPDDSALDPASKFYDARHTAESPKWYNIDVRFSKKYPAFVPLERLKQAAAAGGPLEDMPLLRKQRLSVHSMDPKHYAAIEGMADAAPAAAGECQ